MKCTGGFEYEIARNHEIFRKTRREFSRSHALRPRDHGPPHDFSAKPERFFSSTTKGEVVSKGEDVSESMQTIIVGQNRINFTPSSSN